MISAGEAAVSAISRLSTAIDQGDSNAVALTPRDAPLTVQDYGRLEALIEKHFHVQRITRAIFRPKLDTDGVAYASEFATEEVAISLNPIGEPDPRLMDALRRPSTPKHTIYHLARLAAHMRNTKGEVGFQIILEDLAYDLRGASEWAVIKACESFRLSGLPFFPSAREIVDRVRKYDQATTSIGGTTAPKEGARRLTTQPTPTVEWLGLEWGEMPEDMRQALAAHVRGLPADRAHGYVQYCWKELHAPRPSSEEWEAYGGLHDPGAVDPDQSFAEAGRERVAATSCLLPERSQPELGNTRIV